MDDDLPCLNLNQNKRKREASIERPSSTDSQVNLLESVSPAASPTQEHAPWFTEQKTEMWSSSTATKRPRVAVDECPSLPVTKPSTTKSRAQEPVYNLRHDFTVHGRTLQLDNPHVTINLSSSHIPSPMPPVTRQSLRELDFESILRNTQLRHDVLFDPGLQFRQSNDRCHNNFVREAYWAAVIREVEFGCTCVTFKISNLQGEPHPLQCACPNVPSAPPSTPTCAVRNDPQQPNTITLRMPSRIQPLLSEFLEVLINVLKPIPMAHTPLSESGSYKRHKHEFHQQAAYLRSVFSPQLIEQELQRSTFDSAGLFRAIGSMLKRHCAPMRDAQLDAMVFAAGRCTSNTDTIRVIQMCLDLLERMKLDIANHQLQHLRPALQGISGRFELKIFTTRVSRGKFPHPKVTEEWMQTTHKNLASAAPLVPLPSPAQPLKYTSLTRNQQIYISVLKGFVDLIFYPPSASTLANVIIQPAAVSSHIGALPGYPETTYLDNIRLTQLGNDATSLTVMYMWLLLYRQLRLSPTSPTNSVTINDESRKLKLELRAIGTSGHCLSPDAAQSSDLRRNIVLQISSRLSEITKSAEPTPANSTIQLAQSWCDTHMRSCSPLSVVLRARLRDAVFHGVMGIIFRKKSSDPLPYATSLAQDGLVPLAEDIQGLAAQISQLALIHLDCYLPMYETANGFLHPHES